MMDNAQQTPEGGDYPGLGAFRAFLVKMGISREGQERGLVGLIAGMGLSFGLAFSAGGIIDFILAPEVPRSDFSEGIVGVFLIVLIGAVIGVASAIPDKFLMGVLVGGLLTAVLGSMLGLFEGAVCICGGIFGLVGAAIATAVRVLVMLQQSLNEQMGVPYGGALAIVASLSILLGGMLLMADAYGDMRRDALRATTRYLDETLDDEFEMAPDLIDQETGEDMQIRVEVDGAEGEPTEIYCLYSAPDESVECQDEPYITPAPLFPTMTPEEGEMTSEPVATEGQAGTPLPELTETVAPIFEVDSILTVAGDEETVPMWAEPGPDDDDNLAGECPVGTQVTVEDVDAYGDEYFYQVECAGITGWLPESALR